MILVLSESKDLSTDCRAYVKQLNNIYSQPVKCNYNPYVAKWEGDQGYIPIEECGSFDSNGEFVLDKQKVDEINVTLWD